MLRILLVDDEPLVLIGLQGMLEWEKLGYTSAAPPATASWRWNSLSGRSRISSLPT